MLTTPIVPKNGHTARILAVTRVSDPKEGKQDIRSLRDQRMAIDAFLEANLDIPYEVVGNNCAGKGELIDRAEFRELIDQVETGQFDLVITEDLGRIVRRLKAIEFAETCVDFETRLMTLIEHVDTAVDGWQDNAFFSAYHHERSNRDTSNRIKRTQVSSFLNDGRCAQHPIAGIYKVEGSKSDRNWSWTDDAQRLKPEILRRVLNHQGPSSISDLFNIENFKMGPRCRKSRWDTAMAGQWLRNPLLKGVRYRNKRKTKRNAAGRYISRKADASELILRHVPHLELFTAEEFDAMQAVLTADGESYRRGRKAAGGDSRNGTPRKKTRAPGQMTDCGICGRKFVFGGHGQTNSLMCDGSRQYYCWNGVTFDAELASRNMLAAIMDTFQRLPEFDEAFGLLVNDEALRLDADRKAELIEIERQLAGIDVGIRNLVEFIERGDQSPFLRERLDARETEKAKLTARRLTLTKMPSASIEIPSVAELKALVADELQAFAIDSWEFRQVLGRIVPRLVVYNTVRKLGCCGGVFFTRTSFALSLRVCHPPRVSQDDQGLPLSNSEWPETIVGRKYVRMLEEHLNALRESRPHGRQVLFLKDIVVAQLLAFFNPSLNSLRTIEDFSQTRLAQQFLATSKIAKSTFSDAVRLVEPRVLEPIVQRLLEEARRRQTPLPDLPASLQHVLAVDGSFFRVASDVAWAIAKNNNHGAKSASVRLDLHLNIASWLPEVFSVAGAGVSEAAQAKASIIPGAIHLYDRGFFDFALIEAHHEQAYFVMRMREPGERSPKFRAAAERPLSPEEQQAGVRSDSIGRLTGSTHRSPPDMDLREVIVAAPEQPGGVVRLLTNLLDLDARTISQLYRWRWQIELFFRWLKVLAHFSRPISASPSGVQLNFYVAVIGVLLTCLHSGARPSKYAFSLLSLAASGAVTLEEVAPILAERERRSALDRASAAKRAARRKQG